MSRLVPDTRKELMLPHLAPFLFFSLSLCIYSSIDLNQGRVPVSVAQAPHPHFLAIT